MLDINERLDCIEGKVDSIYTALMGSDLTKDGGIIGRVKDIEIKFDLKVKQTVFAPSGSTINGASTYSLPGGYAKVTFFTDGTDWYVK
ncbi:MAG: hypothetical protein IRZ03_19170 [Acidobacterium ailaaui]|nr:hypothetical protein [Pseudacidobacterium ailaaui]